MKIPSILKPIILVLVFVLGFHAAAPLGLAEGSGPCEKALDRCLVVAAMIGPLYTIYCLEGYAFCKRYIEA